MGNNYKKKSEANVHNTTLEIVNSLLYIGKCKNKQCECPGELFMFLKSTPQNMYNIYCTKCECWKDFRKIDDYSSEIQLMFLPSDILRTLKEYYGEDLIKQTYGEET
jgi:hypothetical protein